MPLGCAQDGNGCCLFSQQSIEKQGSTFCFTAANCKNQIIELSRTRTGLRVVVRDEGKGGAATADGADADGTGLPGMRRRVAALDGAFSVTSPAGGPTVIETELPCAW